jgi:hypothetical protein
MLQIGVGVGAGVVGAILLGHTLAMVLIALGLPTWAGYGIVALLLIGVGLLLVKRLSIQKGKADLVPEESMAKAKRDIEHIASAVRT